MSFGFDDLNLRDVENTVERAAIQMMKKNSAGGMSLCYMVGPLIIKHNLIKKNDFSQANTEKGERLPPLKSGAIVL